MKNSVAVDMSEVEKWISQLEDAMDDLRLVTCVNFVSDDFKTSAAGTLSNIKEDLEELRKGC